MGAASLNSESVTASCNVPPGLVSAQFGVQYPFIYPSSFRTHEAMTFACTNSGRVEINGKIYEVPDHVSVTTTIKASEEYCDLKIGCLEFSTFNNF